MLRLIAIGRLRDGPEAALFERYNARLRPRITVTEIAEARGAPAEVKRREGEALLAALPMRRSSWHSIPAVRCRTAEVRAFWNAGWPRVGRCAS
jgi:23S rRNA (pseudouridine1915-N3)-methyltransferase